MRLPDRSIPRPTFASVFSETAGPEVLHWISEQRHTMEREAYATFIASLPQPETSPSFRDLLLSLASGTKTDGFAYCEQLKSVLDWPVNAELVEIFMRAIKDVQTRHLRAKTIEWVMKTGTRFDRKPGSDVTVYDDKRRSNRRAKVIAVDRPTASATVEFEDHETRAIVAELLVA